MRLLAPTALLLAGVQAKVGKGLAIVLKGLSSGLDGDEHRLPLSAKELYAVIKKLEAYHDPDGLELISWSHDDMRKEDSYIRNLEGAVMTLQQEKPDLKVEATVMWDAPEDSEKKLPVVAS